MVYKSKKKLEMNPETRQLNDMKSILCDQKWAETAPNADLYYMQRGVKKKNGLRYDITIIPPKTLGKEFVKTKGHYHVNSRREIYKVLDGKGIFLMQKTKADKVEDVYAVKGVKGDIIVIPSDYGHITINPGSKELKMANWVSEKCKSDYSFIAKKQGACYFALKQKTGIKWVKNKNYKDIPKLRFEKPLKTMPKNLSALLQ